MTNDYLSKLSAVFLLLGPFCNMTCRHCSQTPIKNTFSLKPEEKLSYDIVLFLKNWLLERNNKTSTIYFWGGEPLLYWETIKECIILFESYDINPRRYLIFTNGLLITDEVVDFCNSHNVQVTMSYDAPNPLAVRNNIPSEENIKIFLRCNKRCVNTVFNALNSNPTEAFNMLEKIFPNTFISMGVINVLSDIPKDIYTFEDNQIENSINNLADEIVRGNDQYSNRYLFFRDKFILNDNFNFDNFLEEPFPPCAPGKISLSLKFNGDIVLCHNDNRVISNIKESYDVIYNKHLDIWKELLPDKCKKCSVLSVCRNRCPIGMFTEDKTEYIHCDTLRKYYSSIINNKDKVKSADKFWDDALLSVLFDKNKLL